MKRGFLIVFIISAVYCVNTNAQGTNCSNAITIPLDGNCYTYSTSTQTGSSEHCSGSGYTGNSGRVTFFKFTTNSNADCVLMDMETSVAGVPMEAALYTGCTGTTENGLQHVHSMCFDDGNGLWAPNLEYGRIFGNSLLANTTYYLRVRTESGFSGTIQICAKNEVASNNLCSGSTAIDTLTTVTQNNACNTGSTEVTPGNLCAGTLENTAWYTYTVLTTGVSSIIISKLYCDNANVNKFIAGPSPDNYGFQIGFFTGNCGSLVPTNCVSQIGASGGTVIASSTVLPAGTVVHVAIDGYYGSNCKYDILAINAVPLPVKLKYFEGWRGDQFNVLTWVTLSETNNQYFEIERSADGVNFSAIGRVPGLLNSKTEKKYSFKDDKPLQIGYYRFKQMDVHGNINYSRIIRIVRTSEPVGFKLTFENPVHDILKLNVDVTDPGPVQIQIIDVTGRAVLSESVSWYKGFNQYRWNTGNLPTGSYYLVITSNKIRKTFPLVKF